METAGPRARSDPVHKLVKMIQHCTALLALNLWATCAFAADVSPNNLPSGTQNAPRTPAFWRNATVYFLMTDRFNNGDPKNDQSYVRKHDADLLRGFEGGDIAGVTQKIESGYFSALGVNAIWTTPLIENVHGSVSENEWGKTYPYHGYWPLDWSAVDANFGTEAELKTMIDAAHKKDIRVLLDVIVNHAGAPTDIDPHWPQDWVRKGPSCDYKSFNGNVRCALSFTLQDVLTEADKPVALPDFLLEKWRKEGRLEQELKELDTFFADTKLPRLPQNYIVKWLTDWVREYGVDGFRVDTAKHTDAEVWTTLKREALRAQAQWRANNPQRMQPDQPFYMVGEVYGYGVDGHSEAAEVGLAYDYGDRSVNFFDFGFDALINMGFPTHAAKRPAALFAQYQREFSGRFAGLGMLNYISSHDDGKPLDPARKQVFDSATKLMLAPGAAQIYYGDEIARSLVVPGAKGDSTLRSIFDWNSLNQPQAKAALTHWQKLGQFRARHLSVGAGTHQVMSARPYVFSRSLLEAGAQDQVVIALDVARGDKISVQNVFADGDQLTDAYTGAQYRVEKQRIRAKQSTRVMLLERAR
jgi:alpha-amylase